MEQIDETKRKPRRTKGTPSYYYRNRFACAFIAVGTAVFAAWSFTPYFKITNEKLCNATFHKSEEEIDRRGLFGFAVPRTSRAIQEAIDEKKRIFSER